MQLRRRIKTTSNEFLYPERSASLGSSREASICGKLYIAVNATEQGGENKKPRNALQVFCEKLWMCFVYRNEDKRTMEWSERTPWWLDEVCPVET